MEGTPVNVLITTDLQKKSPMLLGLDIEMVSFSFNDLRSFLSVSYLSSKGIVVESVSKSGGITINAKVFFVNDKLTIYLESIPNSSSVMVKLRNLLDKINGNMSNNNINHISSITKGEIPVDGVTDLKEFTI